MDGRSRSVREVSGESNRTVLGQFLGTYVFLWVFLGCYVVSIPGGFAAVEPGSPFVVLAATVELGVTVRDGGQKERSDAARRTGRQVSGDRGSG